MTNEEICARRRKRWITFDRVLIMMTLIFIFGRQPVGELEGSVLPPVRNFVIETISEDPVGGVNIIGSLEVLRDDCSLVGVEWDVSNGSASAPIQISFIELSRPRALGVQTFGPWGLNISPSELELTTATMVHQCPWRPWKTRTRLYPTLEE